MFNFNSTVNNINDKSSEILMDADFSILFFFTFSQICCDKSIYNLISILHQITDDTNF